MRRLVLMLALGAGLAVVAPVHGDGGTPTYADVAPIFDGKCAGCHVQGGIAPFSLTNVKQAQAHAADILRMTQLGAMPPWPPGPDSQPLVGQDSRLLTAPEKDLIARWVAAGAPAGPPVAPAPKPPAPTGLVIAPRAAYLPHAAVGGLDDYHCTLLTPKLAADRMVTAARVIPGQPGIVHHVILFEETGAEAAAARAKDKATGGKGWTCFGGPNLGELSGGVQAAQDTLRHSRWLGVWVPGKQNDAYPPGTAVPLPKSAVIVLQIHYNLIRPAKPDRTRVVLRFAPPGAQVKPLETQLFPAPVELPCPAGATGALCSRDAAIRQEAKAYGQAASYIPFGLLYLCNKELPAAAGPTTSCDRTLDEAATIYAVGGHMHLRGVDIKVELNPGRPNGATLLHIPAWNFRWQDFYALQTPVAAPAGSVVRVTCTFDNSAAHQPVVGTRRLAPRYVLWGEGTTDEMCLGVLQTGAGIAANATRQPQLSRTLPVGLTVNRRLLCPVPG
jgi:Copper type II ascorbate-dependent monooxygenase, C-terminal domain